MNRHILAATAALALMLAGPAFAQTTTIEPDISDPNQPPPEATLGPQEFATMATHSNMFEIQSSELALEKAQEGPVREFAQRMIDDHTRATQEMAEAAEADGVAELPQTLDPRHQGMLSQLESVSGEEFDSQYIEMQVGAHQEAVTLFGNYANQGEGALADFAEATLPALEEHLAMARDLAQSR